MDFRFVHYDNCIIDWSYLLLRSVREFFFNMETIEGCDIFVYNYICMYSSQGRWA